MEISALNLSLIVVAGFGAGIYGAMIGSTLLIIVPMLHFLGMPIQVAIGTGKISVVGREIIPSVHFWQKNLLSLRRAVPFSIAAVVASFFGSMVAIELNGPILEKIVAVFMCLISLIILMNPKVGLVEKDIPYTGKYKIGNLLSGLLIGFYTGLFGGGSNVFIIISFIVLFGYDFLNASANSKIPNLIITLASLPVFIINGYVSWLVAIPLTIGTAAGAHFGAKLAIKKGSQFIRSLFVGLVLILTFKYLLAGG